MGLEERLQQRVRASKDEEYDEELESDIYDSHEKAPNEPDSEDSEDEPGHDRDLDTGSDLSEDNAKAESTNAADAIASISFGALAAAQASLGPSLKRKRRGLNAKRDIGNGLKEGNDGSGDEEDGEDGEEEGEEEAENNERKHRRTSRSPSPFHEAEERRAGKKLAGTASRASKHAPTEQSSKKAVSRRRTVVSMPSTSSSAASRARDPRFSSLSGGGDAVSAAAAARANYAFLDEYRADELAQLRATAARNNNNHKKGDEKKKEALQRQVRAMEDRDRAARRVEEERQVVREHRRRERDAVRQGKQPFFLKRGEIKKQALAKRYEGLSDKKMDRIMEKRRKKKASKEKRHMPRQRRTAVE